MCSLLSFRAFVTCPFASSSDVLCVSYAASIGDRASSLPGRNFNILALPSQVRKVIFPCWGIISLVSLKQSSACFLFLNPIVLCDSSPPITSPVLIHSSRPTTKPSSLPSPISKYLLLLSLSFPFLSHLNTSSPILSPPFLSTQLPVPTFQSTIPPNRPGPFFGLPPPLLYLISHLTAFPPSPSPSQSSYVNPHRSSDTFYPFLLPTTSTPRFPLGLSWRYPFFNLSATLFCTCLCTSHTSTQRSRLSALVRSRLGISTGLPILGWLDLSVISACLSVFYRKPWAAVLKGRTADTGVEVAVSAEAFGVCGASVSASAREATGSGSGHFPLPPPTWRERGKRGLGRKRWESRASKGNGDTSSKNHRMGNEIFDSSSASTALLDGYENALPTHRSGACRWGVAEVEGRWGGHCHVLQQEKWRLSCLGRSVDGGSRCPRGQS